MSSWTRTAGGFLKMLVVMLLVVLLHLTVIRRMRIFGIGPDLSILLVVYIGLWRGAIAGTAGGFLMGILQGASCPVHFGSHALAKSIVGFGAGKIGPHVVRESLATQAAIIIGAQVAHDLILLPIVLGDAGFLPLVLVTRTIPGAVYSALLGCLIFRFVLRPLGLNLRSHGTAIL
ncbi:MAG: rod shape-determining protein MreD [Candidatus Eisenbacteria sp.]|nr:rod shape-determining protein MreD [Candidatus Eisenbacteria bacterium]